MTAFDQVRSHRGRDIKVRDARLDAGIRVGGARLRRGIQFLIRPPRLRSAVDVIFHHWRSLSSYTGPDAGQITLTSELNKLASNIAQARNIAGLHWRSDTTQAILLGEAVAISILRDQRHTYNETFAGFTFTKFDGDTVTI